MLKNMTQLQAILFSCLGSALIGSSAVFVRLSDLGPLTTGFYRMLFALPLLGVWVMWERHERIIHSVLPIKHGGKLFLAGTFFALDLALWNWSIDYTTIVNSTLFNNTAAFFVPLIMWIGFSQKPTLHYSLAALIGFVGCICLAGESFSVSYTNLLGDMVALLSGFAVALYLVTLKSIRADMATGFIMFWTGFVAAIFLFFLSYLFGESLSPLTLKDIISVFGQAILVHTLGQSLLAYSIGKIPANYTAVILFLAPVTGALLGWVIYDEALNTIKIMGMILIMVSIVAVKSKQ